MLHLVLRRIGQLLIYIRSSKQSLTVSGELDEPEPDELDDEDDLMTHYITPALLIAAAILIPVLWIYAGLPYDSRNNRGWWW